MVPFKAEFSGDKYSEKDLKEPVTIIAFVYDNERSIVLAVYIDFCGNIKHYDALYFRAKL